MGDNSYNISDSEVDEVKEEIFQWFNHSGRGTSIHHDDKIVWAIFRLEYLKDNHTEFTIDNAREVIRILFPTKARRLYVTSSSYAFKHLLDRISSYVGKGRYKYCSNDTIIKAFELEGFEIQMDGPNACMNLSAKEVKTARTLYRG